MAGTFSGRSLFGFIVIPASLAFIAFTIIVFAVSCGRGAPESASGSPNPAAIATSDFGSGQFYKSNQVLSSAKSELLTAEVPRGVEPEVWDALKYAFLTELERAASAAPKDDAGMVQDLLFDSALGALAWSYVNRGDYDLSGDVGIPDITAIALNFGKTVEYLTGGAPAGDIGTPQGKENHQRAWIDADNSGEIGVSDVTPIALNYLADVAGYAIITSDSATAADGEWEEIDRVPLGGTGSFPIQFYYSLPTGAKKFVAVRPYSADGGTGALSNLVSLTASVAPIIYAVNKPDGVAGEVKIVSAAVSGTQPMSYEWSFGGGANPNTSDNPMPTVQLKSVGWYNGRLTVRNAEGESFFDFQYYVSVQPLGDPVPVITQWPTSGDAPMEVFFAPSKSFSPNGEIILYEWDFESDGEFELTTETPVVVSHTYEGGNWQASLRITDVAQKSATAQSKAIYAFPDSKWIIEDMSEGRLNPEKTRIIKAFEHPVLRCPAFAYNHSDYFGVAYLWNGEWIFQEHPVQLEMNENLTGPVVLYNGEMLFFISKLNTPRRMLRLLRNSAWTESNLPDLPLTGMLYYKTINDIYDDLYVLTQSPWQFNEDLPNYIAKLQDGYWDYESLFPPSKFISDFGFTSQGVSIVTGFDSIFYGLKTESEWDYEFVDVFDPPLRSVGYLLTKQSKPSLIALYDNETNYFMGLNFYAKTDGIWKAEPLVVLDEQISNYNTSLAESSSKVCYAIYNYKGKVIIVLLYNGKEWVREQIALPSNLRNYDYISANFDSDGRLYIYWKEERSTTQKYYLYRAIREPFE